MRVPPRPLWASYPLDHAERAALGWKVMDQIGMTITLDLPQEVQAELASQAAAHGMGIDAYAASLLKQAVYPTARACPQVFDKERARVAGARIRELCKGVTLGGLTIRQLIDEGRK